MTRAGPAIEDHGAIGDARSIALVTRDGVIDWLCWPRFDSPAVFAALLDPDRGGAWSLAPVGGAPATRAYVAHTNVLETRFASSSGVLVVTDLMSATTEDAKRRTLVAEHELLRVARCERGEVELEMRFEPRPDFGRAPVELSELGALGIRCRIGAELMTLRADAALELEGPVVRARFTLRAGEHAAFSLTYDAHGPAVLPPLETALERVAATVAWWQAWIGPLPYDGVHRDAVARSFLAIKLLSYAPSGAIVAAATASLPERIGGDLNWDYRFCWLRDAAFTARALHGCGFRDEAAAYCSWLLHATRLTRPRLGVLYDVFGRPPRDELVLDHLAGYRGSRPVRIHNGAVDQLQLDSYGEVIEAAVVGLPEGVPIDRETQGMLGSFGTFVCRNWQQPDHGIWEGRDAPAHHTFSKVMCWVALDRLLGLAEDGRARGLPVEEMRRQREAIADEVRTRGFDASLGSYVEIYGGTEVDASLLLLAWYGFEPAESPRMRGTLARIEDRLRAAPGLYYRNEQFRGREGAFHICSFWVAELLARGAGTLAEARAVLDAAVRPANELGLFAEEVDPGTGAALGNFPQAYTHVGLINAALAVSARERREATTTEGAPRAIAGAVAR